MARIERPFYPIIYVRGYAMTQDEIVQTTSTPFMGFEAGSTKIRQAHDGSIVKFVFESPLVRLMKDYGYVDNYSGGAERRDGRDLAIHLHAVCLFLLRSVCVISGFFRGRRGAPRR